MSRPPANCWQLAALKPAKAQLTGIAETTRGAMPGAPKIRAAILPGREAITNCRKSAVSMKALTVSVLLLRKPSYEKKKKARFLPFKVERPPSPNRGKIKGPPML